jgi:hypothetical protein
LGSTNLLCFHISAYIDHLLLHVGYHFHGALNILIIVILNSLLDNSKSSI